MSVYPPHIRNIEVQTIGGGRALIDAQSVVVIAESKGQGPTFITADGTAIYASNQTEYQTEVDYITAQWAAHPALAVDIRYVGT